MPITFVGRDQWDFEPSRAAGVPEAVRAVTRRQVVSESAPRVHVAQLDAGAEIPLHRHPVAEVVVVLSGSGRLGGRACGPGEVVVIDADEPYDVVAGPSGPLTFVVVRASPGGYVDDR